MKRANALLCTFLLQQFLCRHLLIPPVPHCPSQHFQHSVLQPPTIFSLILLKPSLHTVIFAFLVSFLHSDQHIPGQYTVSSKLEITAEFDVYSSEINLDLRRACSEPLSTSNPVAETTDIQIAMSQLHFG
ncbi:MAG: hypothetical protein NXY57DRAFT_116808 [Lentinula lateritia]|nr:MAG: hypothetical protein NXY57DRAFT_116808 [Lentinula lateritia]